MQAARSGARALFVPVSYPLNRLGAAIHGSWESHVAEEDTRGREEIVIENDRLRVELANLTEQLNALKQLNADRALLGALRELCTPVAVVGGDSGSRDSLLLKPVLSIDNPANLPVLFAGGLVGRLDRFGTQARLITDVGFTLTGSFSRLEQGENQRAQFVRIDTPPALVRGVGRGRMVIHNLDARVVSEAGLQKGDWVLLNDNDWPRNLQGLKVGQITEIVPWADAPQFSEIRIEPLTNFQTLREVMVLEPAY